MGSAVTGRYVHGDGIDSPLVQYDGDNIGTGYRTFLTKNHQGSIIALSNNSGSLTKINHYGPYGEPDSTNEGRFGYTGQMVLPEIGLQYYKARIYNPKLGRFMQTDPVGYEDQMNLYAYVGNDPVNMVDPTGMYGRGDGWTDEDWDTFDEAQKQAANDMSSAAASLRDQAAGMKKGETNSDGYSGSELEAMASSLDAGAAALRYDGSNGFVANAGTAQDTGGFAAQVDKVGGKIMTVNTSSAAFGTSRTTWMVGHESLHSAGLADQKDIFGYTAYRYSTKFADRAAFKGLKKSKRHKNPDHVMQQVYP